MKEIIKFSTLEEFEEFKKKGYSGFFKGKLLNILTYFCAECSYKTNKCSDIIRHQKIHSSIITKKKETKKRIAPKRMFSKKQKKYIIDLYCYEDINDIKDSFYKQ